MLSEIKKYNVVIIGAGKIGYAIAKMLMEFGLDDFARSIYNVCLVDSNAEHISKLSALDKWGIEYKVVDVNSQESLLELFKGKDSVLSACPYTANVAIATAALKSGISYFDLTEDRYTTAAIKEMAALATVPNQIFMPQCGLAPGFIGMLGMDVFNKFEVCHEIKMRVGALPKFPSNMLKYNLTWSTEGLINEYANPCEAIVDFEKVDTIGLEGVETFSMGGIEYEAFNTSGGLGTLCDTLSGKVRDMNYKTLRYPGHANLMKFLIRDLNLGEKGQKRDLLKKIFDESIPTTPQDEVIAFCTGSGIMNGKLQEYTRIFAVPNEVVCGENWTAIQLTTASGACAVLELHRLGYFKNTGFQTQESVPLNDLLSSTFGRWYSNGEITDG